MQQQTNETSQCSVTNKIKTKTNGTFPYQDIYSGIPQNFLINVIGFSGLLLLFLVLRKSAWKVVNRLHLTKDITHWSSSFVSFSSHMLQKLPFSGDRNEGMQDGNAPSKHTIT